MRLHLVHSAMFKPRGLQLVSNPGKALSQGVVHLKGEFFSLFQHRSVVPPLSYVQKPLETQQRRKSHDQWITVHRLNGDQSNQGRQLSMAWNQVRIYRVTLYTADRPPQ